MVLSEQISIRSHIVLMCVCLCASLSVCVPLSRCAPVSHGVRLGNRLGVSRGVRPGSPPSEPFVCVCERESVYVCVSKRVCSLTTPSRAHWQALVNKMDGVDSYSEFIAPPESIENKYIYRNYEARDQNEYLTFHIPPSLFPPLSLCFLLGDSCWLHENHSSLRLYHKTIDSERDEELYWLHVGGQKKR